MRILVADDDAEIRRFAARALGIMGHSVETAADGAELLRLAAIIRPDLILSDVDMPGCDGIEACRRLRRELPGTRFLLMTGNPEAAAAAAGPAGFPLVLRKPFELDELREMISSLERGL